MHEGAEVEPNKPFVVEGGVVTRRDLAVEGFVRAGAFRIRDDEAADLMTAPARWRETRPSRAVR